ncbi:MAG: DUF3253 domain-containing protein [Hyphomicrobiaceae bacterium]|nr:DUF3253 domain-containing protein [Hyphomicrobiaceae bacterium]
MERTEAQIELVILEMTEQRGPNKSICPSDVARRLAGDGDWRAMMVDVRSVAVQLALAGKIAITQGGVPVHSTSVVKGPIRLRTLRVGDDV